MLKKIFSCVLVLCLTLSATGVFAAENTTSFFASGTSASANTSGYGVTYVDSLDLFVAYGTKGTDGAPMYVSMDGYNWTPRMKELRENGKVLAFAYGNNKGIAAISFSNTPHTDNYNNVAVFNQHMDGYTWATTVPADATSNAEYVSIRGTMIWDKSTGKFWAGGWKYNGSTQSNYGLYYSDGNMTEQIIDSDGNIVTEEAEGTTKRSVMKWTKTGSDLYTSTTDYKTSLRSGLPYGWITSSGNGMIVAGIGFAISTYDPRCGILAVDASSANYSYYTKVMSKNIKTGAIDSKGNIVLSISSDTSGNTPNASGLYKTSFNNIKYNSAAVTQITNADGTASYGTNEVVEEILVLDDMFLCFPQRASNGDVKAITYDSTGNLNSKYVNFFNDSNATVDAFMSASGDRMNKAAVDSDGRVVAMTGKPMTTDYTLNFNANNSKMLVFDTKDLTIDSSVAPTTSNASIATVVAATDILEIKLNGTDTGKVDNEEFAVPAGNVTVSAEFYNYVPTSKYTIIAIYKGDTLEDVELTTDYKAEKTFASVPENCTAKVYFWNGTTLEPLTK